jgi:HAD superfamily hydrolase (TIGR01549 family)
VSVTAVVFDVGETLVDESSHWEAWAVHLGVSKLTLMATLGGTMVKGWPHRRAIELLAPDHDIRNDRPEWEVDEADLYPDALRCLHALAAAGYRLGAAGNQPASIEPFLAGLGVAFDLVGSSERWGVMKPDPRFFERIVRELDLGPSDVLYVGDRLDNDVLPALAHGMHAVLLRRGPWAVWHAQDPDAARADAVLGTLDDLVEWLG